MTDRLYRSPTDRVIAGVAGGLAVWLNIDPSIVRIAWVLLAIFSGGIFILVYIVMMIVIPLPPPGWIPQRPTSGSPGGWNSWGQSGWQEPGWPSAPGASAPPDASPGSPEGPPAAPGAGPPGWRPPADGSWASPPPASPGWTSPIGGHNAGIVVGAVLILLGVWFLVARYVRIDWEVVWPAIVIVLGVALIVGAIRRGRPDGGG